MHYLIAWISGVLFASLMIAIGWTVFLTFTDNGYWILVMLGLLLPAFVLLNITAVAYTSGKSYKDS